MREGSFKFRAGFYLSGVQPNDKFALLEYFKAKEIHDATLNIPYPYSEADADRWINRRIEISRRQAKEVTFASRKGDGEMVGAVGSGSFEVGTSPRAGIGYWLARPYWSRGFVLRPHLTLPAADREWRGFHAQDLLQPCGLPQRVMPGVRRHRGVSLTQC